VPPLNCTLGGMRTLLAFLSAPFVVAIGLAGYTFLADSNSRPLSESVPEFLVTVVVMYIGAAFVTALLALPVFFLLHRFNLIRSWTPMLVGALIGAIMGAAVGNLASPPGMLFFGVLGGSAGLVFWLVGGFNQRQGPYAQGR
jgi:hypothetical protein